MNTYIAKDLDLFRDRLSLLFFDFHEHFLKDFNRKLESHLGLGIFLKEFAMNSDIGHILDSPRIYFSDGTFYHDSVRSLIFEMKYVGMK